MPLTGGMPRPFLGAGQVRAVLVARRHAARVFHSRRRRSALDRGPHGRRRSSHRSCPTKARNRFSGRACTHTIRSGHRTASGSTSCTGRSRRRDGRVADATLGRIAGATHRPERSREFSGAARFAHGAVCRARGGLVGTVAVGARRGEQGHATGDPWPRAIHLCVGEPGRPPRGRDRGQPHGQPLARAAARSAGRGSRRAAVRDAD